ncbi:MAG TPA: hypothetical protein VNE67_01100 [Acetobacteraceae bacterium]|nr:hypothetical protein [Acetobacteraceae bacterium]
MSRRRPLLPLACGLALLLPPVLAARAAPCVPPPVLNVTALQSELMVLATTCHDGSAYNGFMRRYRSSLFDTEKSLAGYFTHAYGRGGQAAHDRFVTDLANDQSDSGLRQGTDFCPRNQALFSEVMSLRGASELPDYAAGKDLVPTALAPDCVVTAPRRIVRRRR